MLDFFINIIADGGYIGIFFLMLFASAAVPLPSEIVMIFSGFLAGQGKFLFLSVVLAGTAGSFVGSLILYFLGSLGGRVLVEKYGKYLFIDNNDLAKAEKFFQKYGNVSNFVGRLIPIIRTFISFPAGLARMPIRRFMFYTLLGSLIWSTALAYLGEVLGEHWAALNQTFHNLNIVLGVVIGLLLAWYIWRHIRHKA